MRKIALPIIAVALLPTVAMANCPAGLGGKYLITGVTEHYDTLNPQTLVAKSTLVGTAAFPTTASTTGSLQLSGWSRDSTLHAPLSGTASGSLFTFQASFTYDPTTCTGTMTLPLATGSTWKYQMIVTSGGTEIQWILYTTINAAFDLSGNYNIQTMTGQRR